MKKVVEYILLLVLSLGCGAASGGEIVSCVGTDRAVCEEGAAAVEVDTHDDDLHRLLQQTQQGDFVPLSGSIQQARNQTPAFRSNLPARSFPGRICVSNSLCDPQQRVRMQCTRLGGFLAERALGGYYIFALRKIIV